MNERRLRVYSTEAIVLGRRDWGEADRLMTLFSPTYGKLRAVAPGARKPLTRKSGHVELFTRGHFVLAKGRTFDKITQAHTEAYYIRLRANLKAVAQAALVCELADRFVPEGDAHPRSMTC
ncbi:MAG: DNA repair protein RecO [Ardenticatenia bacterium]|nr:DNA repair protein RecO [Ardenticatenia bacterium]